MNINKLIDQSIIVGKSVGNVRSVSEWSSMLCESDEVNKYISSLVKTDNKYAVSIDNRMEELFLLEGLDDKYNRFKLKVKELDDKLTGSNSCTAYYINKQIILVGEIEGHFVLKRCEGVYLIGFDESEYYKPRKKRSRKIKEES